MGSHSTHVTSVMLRFSAVALLLVAPVLIFHHHLALALPVLGQIFMCDFDSACSQWNLLKKSSDELKKLNGNDIDTVNGFKYKGFNVTNRAQSGKGPRKDASKTKTGTYALLSGLNVTGIIQSVWFDHPHHEDYVLQLSASLYRSDSTCVLKIYIQTQTDIMGREIETLSCGDRKKWMPKKVHLSGIKEPFRILLRGNVFHPEAFIGLDNISVVQHRKDGPALPVLGLLQMDCGNGITVPRSDICDLKKDCSSGLDEDPQLCGQLPAELRCTFDKDTCGWRLLKSDSDFQWRRHSNSTATAGTGPNFDHTTRRGYYMYTEATIDDPESGPKAILESVVYPKIPKEISDPLSPYYNACQVRFFYHKKGMFDLPLQLHVKPCEKESLWPPLIVWSDNRFDINHWKYASVPLSNITGRYRLQFVGKKSMKDKGDIAIDDVSLSPECFSLKGLSVNKTFENTSVWFDGCDSEITTSTTTVTTDSSNNNNKTSFEFDTCRAMGERGPTQSFCDENYKSTPVKVKVISEGQFAGVQVWTVPESGTYEIFAVGAAGGNGVKQPFNSNRSYVQAQFNFTAGEKLYILVGQRGTHACENKKTASRYVRNLCDRNQSQHDYTKGGGGGGGGGGTFVFKMSKGKVTLLVVAGGGGGRGYRKGAFENNEESRILDSRTPKTGNTNPNGSGGGGSYNGVKQYNQSGGSLLEGAIGGQSCPKASNDLSWSVPGGFGGGGGACSSGGGGGGYSGGDASATDNLEHNGGRGTSYIHPDLADNIKADFLIIKDGHGFVEITHLMNCMCQFFCNISDFDRRKYTCLCKLNQQLGPDGHSCIDAGPVVQLQEKGLELGYIVVIAVAISVCFLMVSFIVICLYKQHQRRRRMEAVRMELITASQGYSIRTATGNGNMPSQTLQPTRMMAEYNPNYDFVGAKYPEQNLIELNRHKLRLARALGQGAFGEVYKGYLCGVPHIEGELPVAVKTLPALSTEQSEMDFLMEAVIMSKFSHPNIVRFLGVCFESHPRYIIIELLEGGDLKSFLREMRPKPDVGHSPLNVADLLKLSIDIARGCQYLEECHFIHRDIAARNCLLTCKGEGRVAKIADFGMARDIYRSDYYKKGGKAMLPIKWMPPEAFLDGLFTTKTDIWSFGILLWEVFSMGYMPYPGRTNHDVMHYVTAGGRLEPPEQCPTPIYQLMSICWAAIPETRPNFSELIEQLERCTQNPDVLNAELPVFFRLPTLEKDLTVIRPQSSVSVLTVSQPQFVEHDDEEICNNVHESESKEPLIPPSSHRVSDSENGGCGMKALDNDGLQLPNLVVKLTPLDSLSTKSSSDSSVNHQSSCCDSPLLLDATTQCSTKTMLKPASTKHCSDDQCQSTVVKNDRTQGELPDQQENSQLLENNSENHPFMPGQEDAPLMSSDIATNRES